MKAMEVENNNGGLFLSMRSENNDDGGEKRQDRSTCGRGRILHVSLLLVVSSCLAAAGFYLQTTATEKQTKDKEKSAWRHFWHLLRKHITTLMRRFGGRCIE